MALWPRPPQVGQPAVHPEGVFLMKGILAIYRRELGSYFVSPIAYIVIGLFLVVTGYFFSNILSILMERAMMAQMQAMQRGGGAPPDVDVPGLIIRNFVGVISTMLLFLMPMLTMGVSPKSASAAQWKC